MEQLILFFMKNPFILLIILWLLYTMFFRKSPIEKPQGPRPGHGQGQGPRPGRRPAGQQANRMPDFGGTPVFAPKPRQSTMRPEPPRMEPDYGSPFEPMPPAAPPRNVWAPPAPKIAPPSEPVVTQPKRAEPPRAVAQLRAVTPSAPVSISSTDAGMKAELTPDDLAQAVIWAEILGPPRAMRPYRRG